MLWSLIKILAFVAIVALAALGAGYLMEAEGGMQITAAGYEINLGPLQSVIALLVLVALIWIGFKLLGLLVAVIKFLNGDETAISRWFDRGRERRGYQALTEAMKALASGEGRKALTRAAKAEKLLGKPDLTNLLVAQAAEAAGDARKAEDAYKKLIRDPETKFIGIRGILRQRLSAGDTETARKLAEKALELKPQHAETQEVLLELQTKAHDWAGARRTLKARQRAGLLPREVYKRRDAVLALAEAMELEKSDPGSAVARDKAIEANKLSPDLVPAAVMAARAHIAMGSPRTAAKVIRKAWEAQPHPDLAAAFAEIAPDETPDQRIKRFGALAKIHPHHPETRLLMAELNVVAEDFPEARRALGDLAEKGGDARVYTLMAAIERGEGSPDTVVKGWLARALTAPRGPQWVCGKCHQINAEWGPVCEHCGAFDTLSWTTPPTPEAVSATSAQMLPLIVGALEERKAEEPAEEGAVVDVAPEPPEEGEAETDQESKEPTVAKAS
ncbi:heme biosynthesis protein HemY [Jhaorihella thermophila]|uniref:HemY protein n=1 Tax=Jhaorihella thermophila TaxID=488547 RepID=A0A1H5VSU1_9RHOB|nr:heme biosynthesis HemY N-terminal domain-containing protein [Jhaorihella thermophila]SEF90048.1 HemY protein [Jhaorihella thermophila]